MAGPYRSPEGWTLTSVHRVGTLYRAGFVLFGLAGLSLVGLVLRAMLTGPWAATASVSLGAWLTLVFLAALTGFMLFVAIRASSGWVALHHEGVVLTDLLGRATALPWTEVHRVTRTHRGGGPSGGRFVGWSLQRGDGTRLVVPTMYEGVEEPLEALARRHRVELRDEQL